MVITRALASQGWLRLAFIGICAGLIAGTTFVFAVRHEDETLSLLAGYGVGILALALPAALLEWFWWIYPNRHDRAWKPFALSK